MPEQELNRAQVRARFQEMDRERMSACGETGLVSRARRAASWQAYRTASGVIGVSGRIAKGNGRPPRPVVCLAIRCSASAWNPPGPSQRSVS